MEKTMDDNNDSAISEDDWGAAIAEQEKADAEAAARAATAAAQPAPAVQSGASMFQEFGKSPPTQTHNDIDFILDIPVQLTVELGRTKIAIKNLLQLAQGSVVELDGMAGEPMDVLVNGCLIAQGEVVVVNDKFGIRLTDIVTPAERIRKLNK
jgi:flagellar motor switch protein FliN/FliY